MFIWVVLDVLSPVHVLSELVAHDIHLVVFLEQIQTLVNLRRGIFTPRLFNVTQEKEKIATFMAKN